MTGWLPMLNRFILLIVFLLISFSGLASAGADSNLQQGDKLYASGNVKEALPFFEKAVKEKPDSAEAWFKLARTQMLNQYNSASVKSYQRSISLDQNNARAFLGMAIAYLHIGQYNHAKASLKEASRIDPSKKAEVDKVLQQIEGRLEALDKVTAHSSSPHSTGAYSTKGH
jgi:tetratricopeptide (TPR) repeat protein